MPASEELTQFIRDHFRSVWALELFLFLKRNADQGFRTEQLVDALRASEGVVANSLVQLFAGGLIADDDGNVFLYGPASQTLEWLSDEAEELYLKKPDAVRRLIVSSTGSGISAFADSFRWRKD